MLSLVAALVLGAKSPDRKEKMKSSLLGMSLMVLALAACQSAQPEAQNQASPAPSVVAPNVQATGSLCDNPYMPAVEGAAWTSNLHTQQGDVTQVDTITDAGSDAFLVETVRPNTDYVVTWYCTPEGLLWLQTDGGMFSGIFQTEGLTQTWETVSYDGVSLPKDIQPGDTWSSSQQLKATDSTGSRQFDINIDFQAVGMESVTVPAGTFNAMRIDIAMGFKYADIETSYQISDWFAPGVGMVKSSAQSDFGGDYDLALESFAIP